MKDIIQKISNVIDHRETERAFEKGFLKDLSGEGNVLLISSGYAPLNEIIYQEIPDLQVVDYSVESKKRFQIPYSDTYFDEVIVGEDVNLHTSAEAMEELFRVTKRSGTFLFLFPLEVGTNFEDLSAKWDAIIRVMNPWVKQFQEAKARVVSFHSDDGTVTYGYGKIHCANTDGETSEEKRK